MASLALNSVLQNLHVGFIDNKMKSSQNSSKTSSTEDLSSVSMTTGSQGEVNAGFQGDTPSTPSAPSLNGGPVNTNPNVSYNNETQHPYSTHIVVRNDKPQ